MNKYTLVFLIIFLAVSMPIYSQDDHPRPDRIIPPSPEAASLGKFIETPVDMYSGLPQIEVPLHAIQLEELSIPISLKYHSGGIKVEEISSRIGLGWALIAGGNISRTLKGNPDEETDGYWNDGVDKEELERIIEDDTQEDLYYNDAEANYIDLEQDVFYLSAPGISEKFYIEKIDSAYYVGYPTSERPLKIIFDGVNFEVIDEKGYKFYFGNSPNTTGRVIERTYVAPVSDRTQILYTSSWQIKEIVSPNGQNIVFNYSTSRNYTYCQKGFETRFYTYYTAGGFGECARNDRVYSYGKNEIYSQALESIIYDKGSVEFISDTVSRFDLPGDYRYAAINLKDNNDTLFKTYNLKHFYTNSGDFSNSYCNAGDEINYRLMLESVTEQDSAGNSLPPYTFHYNLTKLPNRFSNAQDHWGYYNGENANTSLVPKFKFTSMFNTTTYLEGADKHPVESYAKAQTLEKLKYPTGGEVNFTYQSNTAYSTPFEFETGLEEHAKLYGSVNSTIANEDTFKKDSAHFTIDGIERNNGERGSTVIAKISSPSSCDMTVRGEGGCGISLYIFDHDSGTKTHIIGSTLSTYQEKTFFLTNGNYSLVLEVRDHDYFIKDINCDLYGPDSLLRAGSSGYLNKTVGGLRVKEVEYLENGISKLKKLYKYDAEADSNVVSSGVLVYEPYYSYEYYNYGTEANDGTTCISYVLARTANSQIPLMSGSESIGYSNVQVYTYNYSEGGKEEYKFTTANNKGHEPIITQMYPYFISWSREKRRGLLLEKNIADTIKLLQSDTLEYNIRFTSKSKYYKNYKLGCVHRSTNGCLEKEITRYTNVTEFIKKTSQKNIIYDSYEVLITKSDFDYNLLTQNLKFEKLLSSTGDTITTSFYYPDDYDNSVENSEGIISKNIISKPTEIVKSNNGRITSGIGFSYDDNGNIIESSDYLTSSEKVTFDPLIRLSSGFKTNTTITYYTNGNVSSFINKSGITTSFDYLSESNKLLFQAVNATEAEVFYEGFEEHSSAVINRLYAKTGDKYKATSYYVDFSPPAGKSYTISYYQHVSGKWHYIENNYQGPFTIYADRIDEVKIFPKSATLTSYSYNLDHSVYTICDPNGKISYFEYDSFGRLKLVKDHEGNIIKKYQYNYKLSTNTN